MNTIYTSSREEWRAWLSSNFEKEKEVWFVFPMKAAREEVLPYNDAVEEALCFGWIDGVMPCILSHRSSDFSFSLLLVKGRLSGGFCLVLAIGVVLFARHCRGWNMC